MMVVGYLFVLPDNGVVVTLGYSQDVATKKARTVIAQALDFDRPAHHTDPDSIDLSKAKVIPIEKFPEFDGTVVCHLAEEVR